MTKPLPKCPECNLTFKTMQIMSMHRANVHGVAGTSRANVKLRSRSLKPQDSSNGSAPAAQSVLDRLAAYPHLMSANEVADVLGFSYVSVYRGARSGRIPHYRFGVTYKFSPQELLAWLREHHIE